MSSEIERTQILPTLVFGELGLLEEVEQHYTQHKKISDELLQSLHAVFGNVFVRAVELLENAHFIQYQVPNGARKILKVRSRNEHYSLFKNINFCFCPAFNYQVLQTSNAITCKHVLAGKLAEICKQVKVEAVTDTQLIDMLNDLNEDDALSK